MLLTNGMVSVFAISPLVTVPFILSSALIVLLFLFTIIIKNVVAPIEYRVMLLFLLSCTLTLFLSSSNIYTEKPLNHYVSIVFSVLFGYVSFLSIYYFEDKYNKLCGYVLVGIFISSCYGLVEFYFKQILMTQIELLPRPDAEVYHPVAFGVYYRIRSFSVESGHYASYLVSMIAIIFPYIKQELNKLTRYVFLFVSAISLLLTFSVAGFAFCFVSFILVILISFLVSKGISTLIFDVILLFLFFLFGEVIFYYFFESSLVFDLIIDKLVNSGSMADRAERVLGSFDLYVNGDFMTLLFGMGPAYFYGLQLKPVVSLYSTLLFQYGSVGLLFFLVPIFILIIRIINQMKVTASKNDFFDCQCELFAIIYIVLHFSAISNYWYPWFWLTLSFPLARSYFNRNRNISFS